MKRGEREKEMSMKRLLKKLFPNLIDTWNLETQKKKDRKKIGQILALDEKDYPDILRGLYKKKTGHELDFENPRRLTEKIQWRKLYDQSPVYSVLSDKYAVREWVGRKIGEEYLIPLIGAWEHFKDIDFKQLPEQFVLKTNNASHTNIIVTDKKDFLRKRKSIERRMEYWLQTPFSYLEGIELHYQAIKPMIIAEEFVQPEEGKRELVDYKFHCFNGKPVLCQVIGDRTESETIDFFDTEWRHVSLSRPPFPNAQKRREKPAAYDLMIELASKLSNGFSYVRVDLYEHNKKVLFGEMTFTPASGIMKFEPDEWDYKLGQLWDIHAKQVDQSIVQL